MGARGENRANHVIIDPYFCLPGAFESLMDAMHDISMQLSLGLELEPSISLGNFNFKGNQKVRLHLDQLLNNQDNQGEKFLYLYGPEGSGKSHLLQGACVKVMERHESAIYVSLKNHLNYQEEMLHNLESLSLICIDDLDLIAGDKIWEEALFHLYNASFLRGTRLLMAGKKLPIHLNFNLSDLTSRLAWGLSLKVEPLMGQDALEVLKDQANEVGMALPSEVSSYLLQRSRQDMASLGQAIKIIKKASLEHHRKVTVPFVKQVMGW